MKKKGNRKLILLKKRKQLARRKELTTKLLARNWNELDYVERAYFFSDEALFTKKRALLLENSKHESLLKSLHAALQKATTDEEREDIAVQMVDIQKLKTDNWLIIDEF